MEELTLMEKKLVDSMTVLYMAGELSMSDINSKYQDHVEIKQAEKILAKIEKEVNIDELYGN